MNESKIRVIMMSVEFANPAQKLEIGAYGTEDAENYFVEQTDYDSGARYFVVKDVTFLQARVAYANAVLAAANAK